MPRSIDLAILISVCLLSPFTSGQGSQNPAVQNDVSAVLDRFHAAAAAADWSSYFGLFTEDGVFIGTDVTERWTKEAFRRYASGSNGWRYSLRTRNVSLSPDGNSAWFDEILDSASYGTSRGSGVLINTSAGWKLAQYHLTFPIPNALAERMTGEIRRHEAGR